jgi:hypothetical protein
MASSGSTLVVGDAYWNSAGSGTVGAAYVFTQANGQLSTPVELTASDGKSYDLFGTSVADCTTMAAVGAPFHDGTGAVYLFTQGKTGWAQAQEILPADGMAGDFFGSAVALTKTTLAVGAFRKSAGTGVVYVYTLSGSTWVLQSELKGVGTNSNFGFALSLSGTSLLIGAPGQSSGAGAAYIYTLNGKTWTQQAKLIPQDGQHGGQFGYAAALAGTLAALGSPGKSAAYVYQSKGSGTSVQWSLQSELNPFEGAAITGFGAALALTPTTLVVSAVNTEDREVYVFSLQQTVWNPIAELAPSDTGAYNGGFGTAVALVGASIVVSRPYIRNRSLSGGMSEGALYTFTLGPEALLPNGAPGDYDGYAVATAGAVVVAGAPGRKNGAGIVTAYTRSGANLTHPVVLTAANGQAGDAFGAALAFDGSTLFVAAPNATNSQGAVYVYTYSSGVWTPKSELTAGDGQAGDLFGDVLALSGGNLVVGAPGHNGGTGAAYVFALSSGAWSEQAELTASDGLPGDSFGASVGIDGNTLVVGSPNATSPVAFLAGEAYVFTLSGGSWTQAAELSALDGQLGDLFGVAVAVSGSQIAIGAPQSNNQEGTVYLYTANTGGWMPAVELTEGVYSAAGDQAGATLVLSGQTLIVGAYGDANSMGLVRIFTQIGGIWVPGQWLTAADGQPSDMFGWAIASSGGSIVVGAPNAGSGIGSLYAF